ncbi:helix-turn-helix domain-containing protein [Bdellovibrio sp. SKB1291214]|uniref:DNA-3-methyladenine glycosylase 2 family protein n=1 Tax=Bdellovibrio sp. SKB1291214 TaxID=1732569 RepID=UPI000B51B9C9|nr:Ada metal-binding domain-containing protein [Bdellovibrio sp. SKB1291214]UYL07391.1 helix-turn-helix domain-containing protein [Bdellovibrio sp. SKB1291214]
MKRDDIYYEAMKARDPRFDGKFFVGVKTTGIYCRPICPAKPKRENIEFFPNSHQAEAAGYRPCLRCRPESAPQSPAWIGKSATVQRAMKVLNSQYTLDFDEDRFAEKFGITARHLRRLFVEEIGKTPKQLAFENRLNLARKLIVETNLTIADAAFAAGFSSVRRFNDAFKNRFKKAPRDIRKAQVSKSEGLKIALPYRPPLDFDGLMQSYRNHSVGKLEWFTGDSMTRVVSSGKDVGYVTISNDRERSSLIVEIDFPDTTQIQAIIHRVRGMFDLDSDPVIIANSLETDKDIKKMLKLHPGIRLPSGWDPFELAIGAILGQLVSVEFGKQLLHGLIEIAGTDSGLERQGHRIKLFPTPEQILNADLTNLKTTGIRKQTLKEFSKAILEGRVSLEATQDVDQFLKAILAIKGIGPWTAHYIALKSLRSTDTFPASDLILNRALAHHPPEVIEKMRPWRGYVAALFWRSYSDNLSKKKKRKSP